MTTDSCGNDGSPAEIAYGESDEVLDFVLSKSGKTLTEFRAEVDKAVAKGVEETPLPVVEKGGNGQRALAQQSRELFDPVTWIIILGVASIYGPMAIEVG